MLKKKTLYQHAVEAFRRPTKKNKNFREYMLAKGFNPRKVLKKK